MHPKVAAASVSSLLTGAAVYFLLSGTKFLQFIGNATLFGFEAVARFFRPPFDLHQTWSQIAEGACVYFLSPMPPDSLWG
jgi:hypothetical protein